MLSCSRTLEDRQGLHYWEKEKAPDSKGGSYLTDTAPSPSSPKGMTVSTCREGEVLYCSEYCHQSYFTLHNLGGMCYSDPLLSDEETKAQRRGVICLRTHSHKVALWEFEFQLAAE